MVAARGEVLVLLNNDTVVAPGWLPGLMRHLEDRAVGMVGPVTGRDGGPAGIDDRCPTYGALLRTAERVGRERRGRWFEVDMLAMFCVAMRRDVRGSIGALDERFELGMFEDDDYALRVRQAGYSLRCVEDVYVHHAGRASFDALVPSGEYAALFESNRRRFEEKWGTSWRRPEHPDGDGYAALRTRIRARILDVVPPGGVAVVVDRGDDGLLVDEAGRRCWHFPQMADGTWAGHYPATGEDAVAQLEGLRARGARFVVVPETSSWWLKHYAAMHEYLRTDGRVVLDETGTGTIFALAAPSGES